MPATLTTPCSSSPTPCRAQASPCIDELLDSAARPWDTRRSRSQRGCGGGGGATAILFPSAAAKQISISLVAALLLRYRYRIVSDTRRTTLNCSHLARFATLHPPATDDAIQATAAAIGYPFPSDYTALLRCSDGLEPHTESYSISLFPTSDLPEMNTAYQVQDYLPTFLCIGLDGGGRGIFLSCGDTPGRVYICGMGALAPEQLRQIAPDLSSWISTGFDLNDPPPSRHPRAIDVYLVSRPIGGLKSLYRLIQALNLTIPVSELRSIVDQLPYRLLHGVPYFPYSRKCAEINASERCLAAYEADNLEHPIALERLK